MIKRTDIEKKEILNELGSIVSAACLAHDLGNPPFGHAGEEAISRYFTDGKGQHLKEKFLKSEWKDLTNFEGNANALRLLTNQFFGRREGGYALTYTTLATLVKYPWGSEAMDTVKKKKYGYFQLDKDTYLKIAEELSLQKIMEDPLCYARHPLVYLVEAADDICYEIMDIEDAHKLKILSTEQTEKLFLGFFDEKLDAKWIVSKEKTYKTVSDINERIAFLRASVISKLINECVQVFLRNEAEILSGNFKGGLVDNLNGISHEAFENCKKLAFKDIYNHSSVVKIEITGFKVLGFLLDEFISAIQNPKDSYYKKILTLIPEQFNVEEGRFYNKTMSVVDFISGMTDLYAVDLYQKIQAINL